MPLYDYKCTGCGNIEEVIVPMDKRDKEAFCHICLMPVKRLVNSSYMINIPTGKSVGKENYS